MTRVDILSITRESIRKMAQFSVNPEGHILNISIALVTD